VTFNESIRTCIAKATTFDGRACRSEFWWFSLFVTLGALVAYVIDFLLFWPPVGQAGARLAEAFADPLSIHAQLLPVTSFWFFLTVLPLVAVGVRRLPDRTKPGGWFMGLDALMILLATGGSRGPNSYGEEPQP